MNLMTEEDLNYDLTIFFLECDISESLKDHIKELSLSNIVSGYNKFIQNKAKYLDYKYNIDTYYKLIEKKSDELTAVHKLICEINKYQLPSDSSEQVKIVWHGILVMLLDIIYNAYRRQYNSAHVPD